MAELKKLTKTDLDNIEQALQEVEKTQEPVLFLAIEDPHYELRITLANSLKLNRLNDDYLVIELARTKNGPFVHIQLASGSNEDADNIKEKKDDRDDLKQFAFYKFDGFNEGHLLYIRESLCDTDTLRLI